MAVTKKIAQEQQKAEWMKRQAAKKVNKAAAPDKTIPVNFTKGELKAALIACRNYNGPAQKHPRLQRTAFKRMQSMFLVHEIYS